MIRLIFSCALVASAMTGFADAANREAVPDTGTIAFDVYRGNSPFGTHILSFEERGDELRVTTDVDLRVRIGPITAFRYEHDSVETYRNGELVSLQTSTLKDGERLSVNITRNGDVYTGQGSDEEGNSRSVTLSSSLLPSSHWGGYAVGLETVINTETGVEMPVSIIELGPAMIEVNGRTIETRHVRLEGSLTLDLWYDANGEWVRSQFSVRGQDITYVRRDV